MIQIITDSASDITADQAKEMNIHVVPLHIEFEDGLCPQETESDFALFYEKLKVAKELPKTSSPAPESYLHYFTKAKEEGDGVIVITISSGLSGTVASAELAKKLSGYDKIEVIDSYQAIMSQRYVVEKAVYLRDQGFEFEEIVRQVKDMRSKVAVAGMLDTLTYLEKGGRIPAPLAYIGNAISIKPTIVLKDKSLKKLKVCRGRKAAKKALWEMFEKDNVDYSYPITFGYSSDRSLGIEFQEESIEKYGLKNTRLVPVGGVIGTHVGHGCISISYVKK